MSLLRKTTAVPPSVLFMGSSLSTRLDLLRPNPGATVVSNQASHKQQRENHCKLRFLPISQSVLVRNFHRSPSWVPDTIVKELEPVSFMVQTSSGLLWKRYLDHICARVEISTSEAETRGEGEEEFPNFASSTNAEPITNPDSQESVPTTESDTVTPRRYPRLATT